MAIKSFAYTGAEELWVVPTGVTSVTVDMAGAEGGNTNGTAFTAKGARVQATLTTTAGETLRIGVGGVGQSRAANDGPGGTGGFYAAGRGGNNSTPGPLNAPGGGGGGQSYVKRGGATDADRKLVAGGGGGRANAGPNCDAPATVDTEATTATTATNGTDAVTDNTGGGGGGGWRGGTGGTAVSGTGGTNMAHSTQTSGVTSTAGYQMGNGYIQITYSTPSTVAQRFYHSTTQQDFSASGEVDIRKLVESAPGTDSTTICSHPNAAGTTQITLDPYTNSSTASDIRANCGWAINRNGSDGMNATAEANRKIPAATWTLVLFVSIPASGGATGTLTVSFQATVYKVSSSGARTALFSMTSNTVTSGLLGAAASGALTASGAQSAINLTADETIEVGYLSNMVQVASLVGGTAAGVATYRVGTSAEYVDLGTPVRTNYIITPSVVAAAAVTRGGILLSKQAQNLVGAGVITQSKTVVASKSFSLVGAGVVTRGAMQLAFSRSLVGVGNITFTRATIAAKSFSLVGAGVATRGALVIVKVAKNMVGAGVITASKTVLASKSFNLVGAGVITEVHPVQAFRTFNIVGAGVITGRIEIPIDEVPEGGGGTTVFRRKKLIVDD